MRSSLPHPILAIKKNKNLNKTRSEMTATGLKNMSNVLSCGCKTQKCMKLVRVCNVCNACVVTAFKWLKLLRD